MAFTEGQQVRFKQGQCSGTVARKLPWFDDMYVVLLDGNHKPDKRLAHESDLELTAASEQLLTA